MRPVARAYRRPGRFETTLHGQTRDTMSKRVVSYLAAAVLGLAGAGAVVTRATVTGVAHARAGAAAPTAPKPDWLPADKQGFGTAASRASKVWFTLEGGELSEVYYPRLDTPSFRDLQFVVSDG